MPRAISTEHGCCNEVEFYSAIALSCWRKAIKHHSELLKKWNNGLTNTGALRLAHVGEVIADLRPNRQGHGLGCAKTNAANPVLRVARCLELCAKAWRGKTDGIWVIYPIYPFR
ncbi:uncharacterized [Tachysurus ichikawai]